jgi:Holliday junction resolvasome RuvABC endonuclease subunit
MKILALDIATKTGFKTKNAYGVWDLRSKRDESGGMRLLRFRAKLKEIVELESIGLISYERVAGRFKSSIIVASELVGVLKAFCEDNLVEVASYSASEIKKFATGKGNCNKQAMINSARDKYGYTGDDDNEADAIHLYHLTVEDLGL